MSHRKAFSRNLEKGTISLSKEREQTSKRLLFIQTTRYIRLSHQTSGKKTRQLITNILQGQTLFKSEAIRVSQRATDVVYTLRNIVEANSLKDKIRVLTLDIKNAFYSSPWEAILKAMQEKSIPKYLCHIIGSYNEMTINIDEELIQTGKIIKYLGLHIDAKLKFTQHAKITTSKAMKIV